MIQAPEGFEQSLRNYDPALSLRWGPKVGQWVIEREGRISNGKMRFLKFASDRPDADPKAVEEFESARHGRIVIHYVKVLDRRVHDFLWANDLQRLGADKVVDAQLRGFEVAAARRHAESNDIARQTADALHFMLNRKSVELQHGKADQVMSEITGRKPEREPIPTPKPAPILFDAYGRSNKPKPSKLVLAHK